MASSFTTIHELIEQSSTPDFDDGSQLIKEPFAVEFGNLSMEVLGTLPKTTQAAIGISIKCLNKLGSNKTWQTVLENTMNNPSLQAVDSEDIYHHAEHKTSATNWFQDNGRFRKPGLRKLQHWISDFIPSKNLFDDSQLSLEFCVKVAQRTLVELKNSSTEQPDSSVFAKMKNWWKTAPANWRSGNIFGGERQPVNSADSDDDADVGVPDPSKLLEAAQMVSKKPKSVYKESPLVDIVVFRFPDDKQKQFVVYHLKLSTWTHVTEPNPVTKEGAKVQVGTKGEYLMRRFDVREAFVNELKTETQQKALQEAANFLGIK